MTPYESALSWFLFWAKEFNCSIDRIAETDLEYLLDLTIVKAKLSNDANEVHYIDEIWK